MNLYVAEERKERKRRPVHDCCCCFYTLTDLFADYSVRVMIYFFNSINLCVCVCVCGVCMLVPACFEISFMLIPFHALTV